MKTESLLVSVTLAAASWTWADGPKRSEPAGPSRLNHRQALALTRAYEVVLPANPTLLEPADRRDAVWHEDRFYLHVDGQIEARHIRDGAPAWRRAAPSRALPVFLGSRGRVLIFASPYEVMGIASDDGEPIWKLGDFPAAADAPHVDPEWIRGWKHHALSESRLVSASDRDELICTDITTGRAWWRVSAPERISGNLVANDLWCAYVARREGRTDVMIRRAADGRLEHAVQPPDDASVQAIRLAPDGSLIAIATRELLSYDPKSGRLNWRATAPARWLPATVGIADDRLVGLMADGRAVAVDLASGETAWRSEPLEPAGANHGWLTLRDGFVFRITGAAMQVLAASSGEEVIRRVETGFASDADPPPPVFLREGVALASPLPTSSPITDGRDRKLRVSLLGFPLERGRAPSFQSVELGPFRQPRAVAVCGGGLVVVDGRSLIGYVPPTASRPAD